LEQYWYGSFQAVQEQIIYISCPEKFVEYLDLQQWGFLDWDNIFSTVACCGLDSLGSNAGGG